MESAPAPTDTTGSRKKIMAVMVALIVIGAAAIIYVWVSELNAPEQVNKPAIKAGDKVEMNYIGRLPDGRVFDTSLLTVGRDNANYPKSLTFTLRSNDSYKPFNMTAGNYGSGGTIKGFALGVIGLHQGDHQVIEVSPAEGYPVNPSMLKTFNTLEKVSATETMTEEQFRTAYGTAPVLMSVVTHTFWKWDVLVMDDVAGIVTMRSQPTVGQVVYPFGNPNDPSDPMGWPVVVESYDPAADGGVGSITVRHMVSAEDVYNVKGVDSDGKTFIMTGFDVTNGTFQLHKSDTSTGYNAEVAGRTLLFEVTILKVTVPTSP